MTGFFPLNSARSRCSERAEQGTPCPSRCWACWGFCMKMVSVKQLLLEYFKKSLEQIVNFKVLQSPLSKLLVRRPLSAIRWRWTIWEGHLLYRWMSSSHQMPIKPWCWGVQNPRNWFSINVENACKSHMKYSNAGEKEQLTIERVFSADHCVPTYRKGHKLDDTDFG